MDKFDCYCKIDDKTFRYRASGIIIENNCVLLARNNYLPYLYSVGGGVHIDETAEDAVVREVYEETGVHYEIDRLAYISERFHKNEHRLSFYFLMKQRGTQDLNISRETEQMVWVPLAELSQHEISPAWYKTELQNISRNVIYIKEPHTTSPKFG